MKAKEELNALKEETETVSRKFHQLTDEELEQIVGGVEYKTIQYGETLSDVAQKFGTTVEQLCAWNGITDSTKICSGQRIRVR